VCVCEWVWVCAENHFQGKHEWMFVCASSFIPLNWQKNKAYTSETLTCFWLRFVETIMISVLNWRKRDSVVLFAHITSNLKYMIDVKDVWRNLMLSSHFLQIMKDTCCLCCCLFLCFFPGQEPTHIEMLITPCKCARVISTACKQWLHP